MGYALSSFLITFYILAAGVLVAVVVCVPAWPQYKRLNIEWLETPEDVPTFEETEVVEEEAEEGTGVAQARRVQQPAASTASNKSAKQQQQQQRASTARAGNTKPSKR